MTCYTLQKKLHKNYFNFLEIGIIANAFKGFKIAVGILILDAAITIIKKMQKNTFPLAVMICSFVIMLLINVFSWNFSSISIIIIAAVISLIFFAVKGFPEQKGGAKK